MRFHTHIHIPVSELSLDYSSKVMLLGSCFSENIGNKLRDSKFSVDVNPFGIMYNPLSVHHAISYLIQGKSLSEEDVFFYNGLYHSYLHHSSFSDINKEVALRKITERFNKASEILSSIDIFLITFGTAYAYRLASSGEVVSNCHKLPASNFIRFRLTPQQITESWQQLIASLQAINPNAKFIFTVSPIRHWKDGAHENQLSKSILHLSIDALQHIFGATVAYFPAYEIVMDELRDYRFYSEDMMHPSSVAIDYVWKRFRETYFSKETLQTFAEYERIRQLLQHRPINSQSEEYCKFLEHNLKTLIAFQMKHPHICLQPELDDLQEKIHKFNS